MRGGAARVQHIPDFPGQCRVAKWFGNELHTRIQTALVNDGIARIARGEQHLEFAVQFSRRVGQLPSIHAARQADIGE